MPQDLFRRSLRVVHPQLDLPVLMALLAIKSYSSEKSFEKSEVNGLVVRSAFMLIRALISQDDGGVKEAFNYDVYVRRGGESVGEDILSKERDAMVSFESVVVETGLWHPPEAHSPCFLSALPLEKGQGQVLQQGR